MLQFRICPAMILLCTGFREAPHSEFGYRKIRIEARPGRLPKSVRVSLHSPDPILAGRRAN